ncbi:hypothetical protein [Nonomuraea insulae]|uniref:Uncharacterized protein n=1 Tax=Nonomuraea insulae TaxID=1616787 RepID=A0ABW1CMW6_9ACTN
MPAPSDHDPTDLTRSAPGCEPEYGPAIAASIPVSLSRTRIKLVAFVLLAAAAPVFDTPVWLTLALTLVCLAIPLAVATLGGAGFVRELFLLPPRPISPATIQKDDHI